MGKPDRRAVYEDLLQRYVRPLRRLAWSYEHDSAAREDLFQDIALALWTALPRFRGDSSERTWVYRVAHNTAISFAASRRRREREQPGDSEREPASAAAQEGDAIEQQQRDRLLAAVQELPVAERQIIVLHLEGLSASDIEDDLVAQHQRVRRRRRVARRFRCTVGRRI